MLAIENYALYFTSEAAAIIYALLELDGAARCKKLGITERHFTQRSNELAKAWSQSLLQKLFHCEHPKKEEALAKLQAIFNSMCC